MAKASSQQKKKKAVKVLSSRVAFRGRVFQVTSDEVAEPNGVKARRDVVRHQGSVVIMAVDDSKDEPRVLLVRQYRYAAGEELWELPAGRVDEGESELEGAKRELQEETGFTAGSWKRAMRFFVSPGFLTETMAIYVARDLTRGKAHPEDDEVIAKRFFPLSSLVRMAMTGKLQDAKSISGVLWLDRMISK
jgi:ADP-ribose pyrophosphatase